MPPKQINAGPSEEPWLAFRRKHSAELQGFNEHVVRLQAQLQQDINKAKANLLAKHKKEEEEFWNKARATSNDKNESTKSSAVAKTDVRRVTAPSTQKTASEFRRTQAVTSKAPQTYTPTPAYNTTTQAQQSKKKSAAVTIIDLCSDDDEPVQEQKKLAPPPAAKNPIVENQKSDIVETVIPSASLQLFGQSANKGTPVPLQFKREHSLSNPQSRTTVTLSPIASHDPSTAISPTEQSSKPKGSGFSGWTSANAFHMPASQIQIASQDSAWAFGAPVPRGLDTTSAYTSSPVSTWATSTISALEGVQSSGGLAPPRPSLYHQSSGSQWQQNGGCGQVQPSTAQESASHKLPLDNAEMSKSSVAPLQDEHKNKPICQPLEPNTGDVSMQKSPQTPPRPQQYGPNMLPSPGRSPRVTKAHPQSSRTPASARFRRPDLPASVTKDSMPAASNVRAGSRVSASVHSGSSIAQSQCGLSVTSQTSVPSLCSGRGKRKVVDLSSDEESEYSPPSDDGEPETPISAEEVRKSMKGGTKKPGPVTKKTKLPPPLPPAIASKGVFSKGKNGYGFQPMSKPKPEVDNQAARSPQYAPMMKPQLSPPATPTRMSKKPTRPTATTRAAPVSRSPRKAKLDASAKISQLNELELQSRNNMAIDEANDYEACGTGVVEQVRGGLRRMSITPAPSNAGDYSTAAENIEMLADDSDTVSTPAVQRKKHGAGWNSWTQSRINGDRNLAKSRPNRPLVRDEEDDDDDNSDDPDIRHAESYEIKKDGRWQSRTSSGRD